MPSQRTNTVVIFPDAGDPNIPPIKKGSVSISGAIHNVYLARQLLLGSLPIVMMFDLPESLEVEEATAMGQELYAVLLDNSKYFDFFKRHDGFVR